MPKQLKFDLSFNADTSQAKAAILDLQQSLRQIGTAMPTTANKLLDTKAIKEASQAAKELQQHLASATDVNTGKLNLGQFSASLKQSKTTLEQYQQKLEALGPQGEKAFAKVANSIALAENPTKRVNKHLQQFATTLKNTARWQISSSILHGFIGSIQAAYGYAQDLNKSLNNIRIVTGASVDEMSAFADRANKAAQALSTTTTAYTDAALIYYQQGIRDQEEIAGRVETTIKLANVSRQSAEEVSQEMTAIWNNFYDGTNSLEYYADAITALGAATASSSQEIATGLEKFAAISKTVGLSYEYATAAMATITAQTRQSADTVGTGLRTLFSRLEGLKLGDTLEDGVDLNKYSQALETVGVHALEANGDLRDMDEILYDLGERWDDLTKAQQVALAQTVGGVRQYNNLIALMDNWDKFQENVAIANNSEGTLQEQADIYAESWEAAKKRVKSALESIYNELLNDKFFISLTDAFATFIKGINGIIHGMGGFKGVLATVGALVTQHFAKEMPAALSRIKEDLLIISNQAQQMGSEIQDQTSQLLQARGKEQLGEVYNGQGSMELAMQYELTSKIAEQKRILNDNTQSYSQAEKAHAEEVLNGLLEQREMLMLLGQDYDNLKNKIIELEDKMVEAGTVSRDTMEAISSNAKIQGLMESIQQSLKGMKDALTENGTVSEEVRAKLIQMATAAKSFAQGDEINNFTEALEILQKQGELTAKDLEKIKQLMSSGADGQIQKATQVIKEQKEELGILGDTTSRVAKQLDGIINKNKQLGASTVTIPGAMEGAKRSIADLGTHVVTTSEIIMRFSGTLMQTTAFINSMKRLKDVFTDEDATAIEKFGAVIGALTTSLMLCNSMMTLSRVLLDANTAAEKRSTLSKAANVLVSKLRSITIGGETIEELGLAAAEKIEGAAIAGLIPKKLGLAAAEGVLNLALSDTLLIVLALVAAIAVVIAVGALIVGTIHAISDAYNADAIAASRAAEAAAQLTEKYNETKQAYDNLKASIEEYQTAEYALNTLTKGTQEWKDAIRESNAQALELIDTLNLMKDQDYTIDNDGVIHISKSALNKAEEQKAQEADNALVAMQIAQAEARIAKNRAEQTKLARKADRQGRIKSDNGTEVDIKRAIERLTTGDLSERFAKNNITTDELKQKLNIDDEDLIREIVNLANEVNNNSAILESINRQEGKQAAENNPAIQGSKYRPLLEQFAENNYDGTSNIDRNVKILQDPRSEGAAVTAEIMWQKYIEANGLNQQPGFQQGKKVGQYSVIENDKREDKEIPLEDIAIWWNKQEANEELTQNAKNLDAAFTNLDETISDPALNAALKGFLVNHNLNGVKQSGIDALNNQRQEGEDTKTFLDRMYGDGDGKLKKKEVKALGFKSVDDMVAAFDEGLLQEAENIEAIGKSVAKEFQKPFQELIQNKDMSQKGTQIVADQINQAYATGGSEAAQQIIDFYNNIPADKIDDAAQALNGINWNNTTPDQIRDTLAAAGVEINATDAALQNMIDTMQDFSNLDFSTVTSELAKLRNIANNLQVGDTISPEDYQLLNEAQKDYFAINEEGQYELIGNAEELRNLINETEVNKLRDINQANSEPLNVVEHAQALTADGTDLSHSAGHLTSDGLIIDNDALSTQIALIQQFGEEAGISKSKIDEWSNIDWEHLSPEETVQYLNEIAAGADQVGVSEEQLQYRNQDLTASTQEVKDALAMSATSFDELQEMLENGEINTDAFNKAWEKMSNDLGEGIDMEAMEDMADYLAENADSIKGVSNALKDNQKAARKVAQEIARFDRAIDALDENYDDWSASLKKSNRGVKENADLMKGLRKAYGDVLNLSGDALPESFLENAENLELMRKAAEGDEAAYQKLAAAARQEIATKVGFDDTEFQNGFNELLDQYYHVQSLDALEVGADLNDQAFLDELSNMVTQAGMTAEEAQAYLASMGIDATVEEDTTEDTETNEVSGYKMEGHIATKSGSIDVPDGDSIRHEVLHAEMPYFTAEPDPQTVTTQKQNKSFALKVTSAQKSSGGNFKHNNGSHGGGGGGRRGGGGGRRGGGRRAERNKEQKKSGREGIDRYHVVTTQLETLGKQYDKISTAYDRAFGKNKLKLLDDQIKKKQELIKTQKKYTDEIKAYQKVDKANLTTNGKHEYWSETDNKFKTVNADAKNYLGMDVKFDENGVITNYEALIEKANAKYNAAVDVYNSKNTDDEAAKRAFEAAQAQYDGFMEYLNQYEETEQLYLDEMQNYIDQQNELYDMMLEKTQLTLKLRVDVDEDNLKLINHLIEQLSDNAYDAAKRIALMGQDLKQTTDKVLSYRKALGDLFENHGFADGASVLRDLMNGNMTAAQLMAKMKKDGSGVSLTEEEADFMRETVDNLMSENSHLMELRKGVIEEIGTVMDANKDKLDKITDKMNHLKNVANSYKNIIDLTGRKALGVTSDLYDAIEATNVNLAKQSVAMSYDRMHQAKQQLTALETEYAAVKDQLSEQEKLAWDEQINTAKEYVQEMTEDYYSSWEEAIEAVQTRFESAMKNMAEDFGATMGGMIGSLEGLQNRMDLKKTVSEQYLPEYEKIYQLGKLADEAQKKIDQSSNIKVQQELQKIQDKILAARKDGQKISQYEVDFMQKELELKAAQLALEEAGKVKSQVRMSRDSEGNYAYVYTTDEKAVQDAESEYNAKLYEMQKLNEEYIASIQDQIVSMEQEYISAMQEAAEMYGLGTTEYYEAIRGIQADYQLYFDTLNSQMGIALANNQLTATEHAEMYSSLTGDYMQANVDLTTSFDETVLSQLTGYETLGEYQQAWAESSAEVYQTTVESAYEWSEGIKEVYEAAESKIDEFAQTTSDKMAEISQEGSNVATEMENTTNDIQTAIEGVVTSVGDWEQQHSTAIQNMIDTNTELINSINAVLDAYSGISDMLESYGFEDMTGSLQSTLSNLTSQLEAAKTEQQNALTRKNNASSRKTTARRKLDKASRAKGVQKIVRARRKASDIRRKLNTLKSRRRLTRREKKQKRRLERQLRRANRQVRRLQRRYRRNWNAYTRADSAYRTASTNYDTAAKNYENATNTVTSLEKQIQSTEQQLAAAQAQQDAGTETATSANTSITSGSVLDEFVKQSEVNNAAMLDAISRLSSPQVNVTLPEMKQDVSMTITLPNITSAEEFFAYLTDNTIPNLASLYVGRTTEDNV